MLRLKRSRAGHDALASLAHPPACPLEATPRKLGSAVSSAATAILQLPPHAHAAPNSNGRSSAVVRRQQLNMAPYNAVLEYRGVLHHMGRASTPHASPSQGRASTSHGSSRPPKAGGGGDSSLPVLAQHPRQKSPGAYEQAALQSVRTHYTCHPHTAPLASSHGC